MSKKQAGKGKEEEPVVSPAIDPSVFVILESCDGERFFVDRNCARLSRLCRSVLNTLESNTPTNTIEVCSSIVSYSPTSELVARPDADQQGSAVASSSSSALTYPCVRLNFLSSTQLLKAISFMHYKYRFDSEAEKKPQLIFPKGPPQGRDALEWAAIATMLQL